MQSANIPELRKYSQICPECFGFAAGLRTLCQISILIAAEWRDLQQRHFERHINSDARLYGGRKFWVRKRKPLVLQGRQPLRARDCFRKSVALFTFEHLAGR